MKDHETALLIPNEILEAEEGLENDLKDKLYKLSIQDNALTIAKFAIALQNEDNISLNYKTNLIRALIKLSKIVNKKFSDMTREDLLSFLNSLRKPEEKDPLHKWIGTHSQYILVLSRFFRWLYYPGLPKKERPKPAVLDNIRKLVRREKSIYKPTDLWTVEDDLLFLKYCPSKRQKCYHVISRDTSCRPHEILGLRIKDVVFKLAGDRQYAEVLVNGKTGSRHIPLINSIPYLKDYLDDHPQRSNPNAYLIFATGKSFGKKCNRSFYINIYRNYKKVFFPKLLQDPKISPEDKVKIKELLKKPWNPYIRRHSALTEKSQILKDSVLRQYAGWSMGSNMHLKYLHYFGNESSESILEAYGLKPKSEEIDKMKPRQCPNCSELAKIDDKFCPKCRMVMSYDAYSETIEEREQQNEVIANLADQIAKLTEDIEVLKNISHN